MYKVIVTSGETKATAMGRYKTQEEAQQAREKLQQIFGEAVAISVKQVGRGR